MPFEVIHFECEQTAFKISVYTSLTSTCLPRREQLEQRFHSSSINEPVGSMLYT